MSLMVRLAKIRAAPVLVARASSTGINQLTSFVSATSGALQASSQHKCITPSQWRWVPGDDGTGLLPLAAAVLAAQLAYSTYRDTKADVITNKINGKEAEEFLAASLRQVCGSGIETQVHMKTDTGFRVVDAVDTCHGILHECKVGKLSKSQSTIAQLSKDLSLKEQGWRPRIHFFNSPETGQGGPTKPLKEFLSEKGIECFEHNHTVRETAGSCGPCSESLREIADAAVIKPEGSTSRKIAKMKATESIESSAAVSQALCAVGALNLAVAVGALAVAMHSSQVAARIEAKQLPELRRETEDLRLALATFEVSLKAEIEKHLEGEVWHRFTRYSPPESWLCKQLKKIVSKAGEFCYEKVGQLLGPWILGALSCACALFSWAAAFLAAGGRQSLKIWNHCLDWQLQKEIKCRKQRVQDDMRSLQERYHKLKCKMEKVIKQTQLQKSDSESARAVAALTAIVGGLVTVASLGADCGAGVKLGTAGVAASSLAASVAGETIEKCNQILDEVEHLLELVEVEYGSVEKTYNALMRIYELLEREVDIPNPIPSALLWLSQT